MNRILPEKKSGWRGTPDLWLDAAQALLLSGGIDAVKVMPLARALGLSRTSFYWHFESREALLDALLQRWRDKNTGNLVSRTHAFAETITEAVFNLFDCWLDQDLFDAEFDFAVRAWAHGSPEVQEAIDAADRQRIEAIAGMFMRFGFSSTQAETRAMTLYYTQIGYIAMRVEESESLRIDRMPDYIEIFTDFAPTASEVERFRARHVKRAP